ncbi:uncharacterized protein [Miscanthus floridulus]|uniref:uncharacterized protein n=1 Tax=Miscanthus floridulus TaxID=154761 RepID=UPI003457E418
MAMSDRPQGSFALRPRDHDLITFVLHPMVARQQRFNGGGIVVHLADVYSVAPERLTERYAPAPGSRTYWYFICPARCRHKTAAGALGEGRWNSETGEVSPVRGADGRRVGHSRTLSYSYGGARTTTPWTTVTRHGWCMLELALDDEHGGGGVGGGDRDFVLCKLFRSPHNEVAVPALLFNCKRKAVGDHTEAPPSVRQQLMQHSF